MFKRFKEWLAARPIMIALLVALVCASVQIPLGGGQMHWVAMASSALGALIGVWFCAAFLRRKFAC